MNRTVTIEISVPECEEVRKALNYLMTWGLSSYNSVMICDDFPYRENHNIMAYYKNSVNDHRYTIGAIWEKSNNRYTFHS